MVVGGLHNNLGVQCAAMQTYVFDVSIVYALVGCVIHVMYADTL